MIKKWEGLFMGELEKNRRLSKNKQTIYDIFKEHPTKTFDVKELIEFINAKEMTMSQRTVYRAVESLLEQNLIILNDIIAGHRKYELNKLDDFKLVCNNCGVKSLIRMSNKDKIYDLINKRYDFNISGAAIELLVSCPKINCNKEHLNS